MALRYLVTCTLINEEVVSTILPNRFKWWYSFVQALIEYIDWLKGGHVQAVIAGGASTGEVRLCSLNHCCVMHGICRVCPGVSQRWRWIQSHFILLVSIQRSVPQLRRECSSYFKSRWSSTIQLNWQSDQFPTRVGRRCVSTLIVSRVGQGSVSMLFYHTHHHAHIQCIQCQHAPHRQ